MRDDDLRDFVTRLGREEMLPAAVHPGVFEPEAFLKEVLTRRLPNAFLPDTPQRIAADTSQKMPVRFGRTLAVYASRGSAQELRLIPLVIAGWLRYLVGVDDAGKMFAPSPDPLLPVLQAALAPLSFGRQYRVEQVHEAAGAAAVRSGAVWRGFICGGIGRACGGVVHGNDSPTRRCAGDTASGDAGKLKNR